MSSIRKPLRYWHVCGCGKTVAACRDDERDDILHSDCPYCGECCTLVVDKRSMPPRKTLPNGRRVDDLGRNPE